MTERHPIAPPPWWMLLLEARAPWEFAALLASRRWLDRLPRGDGHPVLVMPGMLATDLSTVPLRRELGRFGYEAYGWRCGRNVGPRLRVIRRLAERIENLHDRHGQPVSLLGWSLGGLYAREMAKLLPESVRCVITLGSPVSGTPRATNVWRVFQLVNGGMPDLRAQRRLREPPPVPTVSIYSRSDGVVAWRASLNPAEAHCENIEVFASHLGLGVNPLALAVIADRLAQDPQRWRRFDPALLHGTLTGGGTVENAPRAAVG
jgi:pimeloyl-ACP methyl ester carboxylesterase